MALDGLKLVGFDIESTGPEPTTDRIVTANLTYAEVVAGELKVTGSNDWLLDPGIEIPEGASNIHGITTERARRDGTDYRNGVTAIGVDIAAAAEDGRVLVAYNASFDLTMLSLEHARAVGIDLPVLPSIIIDPFVIDKEIDRYRKGKRTLEVTARHYGVDLVGAHTADGDVAAVLELAVKILQHPKVSAKFPDKIMDSQTRAYRMQQERMREYFLKKASQMAVSDPEDAADLRERAKNMRMGWPIGTK